ncbi:hypothetical protein, partial [Listeria monocytogenes]|uniref:hypothetical protein n=1 Tax=Listeria monocytogenes TaxID=1639 RepID=UPI001A9C736C
LFCTACRTRYAMYQDPLCGACAEEAEDPNASTRCVSCGDIEGAYKMGNGGKMIRVQILGNGYCRKCFDRMKCPERRKA